MKRLEISRLMDKYQDNEFCPEEGSAVSARTVKAQVLAKAAPVGKRTPKKKRLLLAAALAAVMVVLVGAGIPSMIYGLASGHLRFEETDSGRITALVHYNPLVQVEDGQLWFTPDEGERVDITNLVSEETPYIYDGSDPDVRLTYYVIVGGTPELYGYFEWIMTPDPFDRSDEYAVVDVSGERMHTIYAYAINGPDRGDDIGGGGFGFGSVYWEDVRDYAWLLSGIEKLDIPVTTERNYTVISEQ